MTLVEIVVAAVLGILAWLGLAVAFVALLARASITAHGSRDDPDDEDEQLVADGTGRIGALYPACETCGRRDGIHKAVVGPPDPTGMHDVERYELACGHDLRPEARISMEVVSLLEIHDEDLIDYTDGVNGGCPH